MGEKESKLNLRLTAQNEGSQAFKAVEESMIALRSTAETVSAAVKASMESMNAVTGKNGMFKSGMEADIKAISGLESSMKGLQATSETVTNSVKTAMESMDSVVGKNASFKTGMTEDETAIRELAKTVASNTEAVSKAFVTMEESVSRSSVATTESVGGIKNAIGDAGLMVGLQQVGQSMEQLGKGGAHLFEGAITSAADFEANVSRIHAVLMKREPTANMKDMSDTALKLGSNSKFSANEIAQGMYDLARQGLSSSQILGDGVTGAIETVNNLAQSVDGNMGETAKVVTDVLHEFNLQGKDLAHVGDEISGAMHTSSISMNDFYYAMRQIGPVASNMHQSVDDVSTSIALLAQHGITGSIAGTALKNMFLGLEPRTKKAAALMHELGISAKDGASESFYQLNGNLKAMPDIIQILNNKFGDLNDRQKQAALSATFTKYGLAGLNVIVGEGKQKFDELKKTLGDEKSADIAREKLNNLQGDMLRLHAATITMGKSFGDTLQPAMRSVAQAAESVVHWFTALSPETKHTIMVGLGLVSAMAVIGGAILTVVSTIGFLSMGLGGLGIELGAVLVPVGLVIAGAAALGFAIYEAWKHWDAVSAFFKKWGEDLLLLLGPIGLIARYVIDHWNQVKETTLQVWNGIIGAIRDAWNYIKPTIMEALKAVSAYWNQVWPMIRQVFEVVWTGMKVMLEPIIAGMYIIISTTLGVIKGAWEGAWGSIKAIFKTIWDLIKDIIKIGWDYISGVFKIALDLLTGNWKGAWNDFKATFVNVWNDIFKLFGDFLGNALNFGKNFVKMIADGIMGGIHQVEYAVKSVVGKVKSFLGFGSPTEEGPGADSDKWAPNFIKMFAGSLADGADLVAVSAKTMISPLNDALSGLGAGGVARGSSTSLHAPSSAVNFGGVAASAVMAAPNLSNTSNRNVTVHIGNIHVNGAGKNGRQIGQDLMQGIRNQIGFSF